MGANFGSKDGSSIRGGFVWDGKPTHTVTCVDISTVRDADHPHCRWVPVGRDV